LNHFRQRAKRAKFFATLASVRLMKATAQSAALLTFFQPRTDGASALICGFIWPPGLDPAQSHGRGAGQTRRARPPRPLSTRLTAAPAEGLRHRQESADVGDARTPIAASSPAEAVAWSSRCWSRGSVTGLASPSARCPARRNISTRFNRSGFFERSSIVLEMATSRRALAVFAGRHNDTVYPDGRIDADSCRRYPGTAGASQNRHRGAAARHVELNASRPGLSSFNAKTAFQARACARRLAAQKSPRRSRWSPQPRQCRPHEEFVRTSRASRRPPRGLRDSHK
jgi:hypothetical protein